MTTEEARDQLSAYIDGELAGAARREVEAALAADPTLRAEAAALRRTIALVVSLPRQAAPPGFAGRVRAALAAHARPSSRPRQTWLRRWRPVLAAAAACVALAIAALLMGPAASRRTSAVSPTDARKGTTRAAGESLREERPAPEATAAPSTAVGDHPSAGPVAKFKAADKLAGSDEKLARPAPEREAPDARLAAAAKPGPAAPAKPAAAVTDDRPAFDAGYKKDLAEAGQTERRWKGEAKSEATFGEEDEALARRRLEMAKKQAEADEGARDAETALLARAESQPGGRGGEPALPQRALDQKELLDAVARKAPAAAPPEAFRVQAAQATPQERPGAPATEVVDLQYEDLRQALADVQATLGSANVAYALQPIGSGRFVVEATMAWGEASALLARLGVAGRNASLAEGQALVPEPPREPAGAPEPRTGLRQAVGGAGVGAEQGARAGRGERETVHLVLRFQRGAGAPGQEATQGGTPAGKE